MRLWVGFDVGKAFHWVCVLDDEGEVLLSRRVEAEERDIETCCEEIAALGRSDERLVATDLLGGPATLLEAVLLGRGERLFHLPGIAVNRARDGYRGESKSDARDARVIADQIRMRWRSLQEVRPREDAAAELRTLVAHRRGLVEDQARVITRLRALLLEVFPGLEAALDLSTDRALLATTRVATPSAARGLGAPPVSPAGSRTGAFASPRSWPGRWSRQRRCSAASCRPPRRRPRSSPRWPRRS